MTQNLTLPWQENICKDVYSKVQNKNEILLADQIEEKYNFKILVYDEIHEAMVSEFFENMFI